MQNKLWFKKIFINKSCIFWIWDLVSCIILLVNQIEISGKTLQKGQFTKQNALLPNFSLSVLIILCWSLNVLYTLAIRQVTTVEQSKGFQLVLLILLISLNKRDLQVTAKDMPDSYLVSELFSKLCELLLCIFLLC